MEDEIPSGSKFVGGARLSRHSKTSKKKKKKNNSNNVNEIFHRRGNSLRNKVRRWGLTTPTL